MKHSRCAASGIAAIVLALGCGGEAGDSSASPDPYPDFGYSDVLYRGMITARKEDGSTASNPIDLTVSPNGSRIAGYNLDATDGGRLTTRLVKDPAFGTVLDPPLPIGIESSGTSTVQADKSRLTVSFTGTNGITATVRASSDVPNIVPGRPPAGTYSGTSFGRGSLSGALFFAGPAQGSISADGTFTLKYVANGFVRAGEMRGRIASDGTVSDLIVIRGTDVLGAEDIPAMAYGTAQDFTLVWRSTVGNQIGETYRMTRIGG